MKKGQQIRESSGGTEKKKSRKTVNETAEESRYSQ